jgi:hypothetical protein
MALSLPLFIFVPVSENKSWLLIYRLPLIVVAATGAFIAAPGLNPCSNGCDDEPVVIAWFAWFIGLAFFNRKNLSWKYWLFLWGLIHVFSMDRETHLWIGGWSGASDLERLQWRAEFYLTIFCDGMRGPKHFLSQILSEQPNSCEEYSIVKFAVLREVNPCNLLATSPSGRRQHACRG